MENAKTERPERRTTLVLRELARVKVDIASLSESRLARDGSLQEADYTFFWNGHPPEFKKIYPWCSQSYQKLTCLPVKSSSIRKSIRKSYGVRILSL